ncbi:hypothetical protein [Lacticaseibacillus paracasei]|uniref:hypothetical protein n=1 Tax=Lacticaseibacillus paracasei TaxID=1597 RepID=UPI0005B4373E
MKEKEKETEGFKKRYKSILTFLTLWIGSYVLFSPYLLSKKSPQLEMVFLFAVPFILIAYLVYDYFKLKIAKPSTLILLLFLLGMLMIVFLQILGVVSL